jgi:hypothetical protein
MRLRAQHAGVVPDASRVDQSVERGLERRLALGGGRAIPDHPLRAQIGYGQAECEGERERPSHGTRLVISKIRSAGLAGFRAANTYVRPPITVMVAVCRPVETSCLARKVGFAGVATIFSEDFASGSTLEGVRFVNPFAPDFVLDQWQ